MAGQFDISSFFLDSNDYKYSTESKETIIPSFEGNLGFQQDWYEPKKIILPISEDNLVENQYWYEPEKIILPISEDNLVRDSDGNVVGDAEWYELKD